MEGSDLLGVFTALALGSIPNPLTDPAAFLADPIITSLTTALTSGDLATALTAATDLAAALLSQAYYQPRLVMVAQDSG